MRLITEKQHAKIMERIILLSRLANINHSEEPAIAILQGLPGAKVVAWMDEYGNPFPLAARQVSIVGENCTALYAAKGPA